MRIDNLHPQKKSKTTVPKKKIGKSPKQVNREKETDNRFIDLTWKNTGKERERETEIVTGKRW